jgi:hypothetical protein
MGGVKTMLGNSLYSYLYLKLAKMLCLSYYLMFSLQQNQRTAGRRRRYGKVQVAQTMYTHVSKCKNDKIIIKKEKFGELCTKMHDNCYM